MIKGYRKIKVVLRDEIGYFKRTLQMRRLEKYAEIIDSVLSSFDRKSHDKTMMIRGARKGREDTTNRKTHQQDVSGIVAIIAKKKKMSVKIATIMAKYHDIGHTFMGHSGEAWISNVLEDYGLGVACHNAIGARELIFRHDIYNKIIEKIQLVYPNISNKELTKIKESLWLIIDAINCHNGEKASQKFIPQVSKTQDDFMIELSNCFTEKGFDRTIEPATPEGCLMRLADQMSYIPYDLADGLREKFILGLDKDYITELEEIGISKQEIKQYITKGNYNDLSERIKNIYIQDLDKNSTKRKIAVSDKIFKSIKNLKKLNDKKIVHWAVQDKDLEIYPQAIKKLIDKYKLIILQSDIITKVANDSIDIKTFDVYRRKHEQTPQIRLIEYVANTSRKEYQNIKNDTELAIIKTIANEQEEARQVVLKGKNREIKEGFEKRNTRIDEYIKYYEKKLKGRNEYNQKEIEEDIKNTVKNIYIGNQTENYVSVKASLAITIGAKYLATLSDREFIQELLEFGIIELKDKQELTQKYQDINIFKKEKRDRDTEKSFTMYDETEK